MPNKRNRSLFKNAARKMQKHKLSITKPPSINHPYVFTRYATNIQINQQLLVDDLGGFSFQLSDCVDFSDFTNLFETYSITMIELQFMPKANAVPQQQTATLATPAVLYTLVDTNDSAIPSTLDEVIQYRTTKAHYAYKPFKMKFVPRASVQIFNGIVPGYAVAKKFTKIDTAYPSVPHYGLKTGITAVNGTSTTSQGWIITPKYTIVCTRYK